VIFRRHANRFAAQRLAPVLADGARSPAAYQTDRGHLVLITEDPRVAGSPIIGGDDGFRWHLSMSHPSRYPTWDELKEARYRLLPDEIYMAQLLPPKADYVNLHENCFHLHELRDGDRVTDRGI
jgi:hypothetical protein